MLSYSLSSLSGARKLLLAEFNQLIPLIGLMKYNIPFSIVIDGITDASVKQRFISKYDNLAIFDLIAPKELKINFGISCIFNTDKSCKHDFQST